MNQKRKGRIFLLGAEGFIGSCLMKRLKAASWRVEGPSLEELDLLKPRQVKSVLGRLTGEDSVIMAAAITRLSANTSGSMLNNIRMASHVADALERHPPGRAVYLSTQDVYGTADSRSPMDEHSAPKPSDSYAISKLAGEHILRAAADKAGIPLSIFRLPGVYGPGGDGKSAINQMVASALADRMVSVHGDGSAVRDYLWVDDFCALVNAALEKSVDGLFNAGTGRAHSIRDMARFIADRMPFPVEIRYSPAPEGASARPRGLRVSCATLKAKFRGVSIHPLPDGIGAYLSQLGVR